MERIILGPTGRNVARNVRLYRQDRHFTYAELSRRLDEIGRKIPPLGLRRIEAGERRVDVDDLTALAMALAISQVALMLPHHFSETEERPDPLSAEEAAEREEALEEIYRQTGQTPKKEK
jgi:transcriptional regulator with XRE-family HTH domain